jgi:hypothetical protein
MPKVIAPYGTAPDGTPYTAKDQQSVTVRSSPEVPLSYEYLNNQDGGKAFSMASKGINDQTRQQVQALLSHYATSGLSRSGIQGAALNNIYSTSENALGNAAVSADQAAANRRLQILQMLLGNKAYQDSQPGFGDFLGSAFGTLTGALTGGIGTAVGQKIGKLI